MTIKDVTRIPFSTITIEQYLHHIVTLKEPFVLTGFPTPDISGFKRFVHNEKQEVVSLDSGQRSEIKLESYLKWIRSRSPNNLTPKYAKDLMVPLAPFQKSVQAFLPSFMKYKGEYDVLGYAYTDYNACLGYWGCHDTYTPVHVDSSGTVATSIALYQERGAYAVWDVWPHYKTDMLATELAESLHEITGEFNLRYAWSPNKLSTAPTWRITQCAGDIVIIPPNCPHQSLNQCFLQDGTPDSNGHIYKVTFNTLPFECLIDAYLTSFQCSRFKRFVYPIKSSALGAFRRHIHLTKLSTISETTRKRLTYTATVLCHLIDSVEYVDADKWRDAINNAKSPPTPLPVLSPACHPPPIQDIDLLVTCTRCCGELFGKWCICNSCGQDLCFGCISTGRLCMCCTDRAFGIQRRVIFDDENEVSMLKELQLPERESFLRKTAVLRLDIRRHTFDAAIEHLESAALSRHATVLASTLPFLSFDREKLSRVVISIKIVPGVVIKRLRGYDIISIYDPDDALDVKTLTNRSPFAVYMTHTERYSDKYLTSDQEAHTLALDSWRQFFAQLSDAEKIVPFRSDKVQRINLFSSFQLLAAVMAIHDWCS